MNFANVEAIADAVLFEGYILYPYRPSAIKNKQRWNFGTLYPRAFAESQKPQERWRFSSQLLIEASDRTSLTARLRFLQLVSPATQTGNWAEGFARWRTVEALTLADLLAGVDGAFDLASLTETEVPTAPSRYSAQPRLARLYISAEHLHDGLYRLHASIANESPVGLPHASRLDVQHLAFTSAHLLLGIEDGAFVSLLEPPQPYEADAVTCIHEGVYPVLVGENGDRSKALCSPIILYDYPQVAPESGADFFDATEMDEMLSLRLLTLSDEEKAEVLRSDRFARKLLERTESSSSDEFERMHGAIRGMRAIEVQPQAAAWQDPFAEHPPLDSIDVLGVTVRRGDRVRLRPQKKADILDMAVEGKVAVVESIEQDLEDNIQLAVVLEDDPGRDLGLMRQAGHRFFYSPEEIEPLPSEAL